MVLVCSEYLLFFFLFFLFFSNSQCNEDKFEILIWILHSLNRSNCCWNYEMLIWSLSFCSSNRYLTVSWIILSVMMINFCIRAFVLKYTVRNKQFLIQFKPLLIENFPLFNRNTNSLNRLTLLQNSYHKWTSNKYIMLFFFFLI